MIWGSADKLLKAIDDEYCISDINEDTYDYKKETYQQVMFMQCFRFLSLGTIDKTEVFFFINTDNSIPKIADSMKNQSYMLLPWV